MGAKWGARFGAGEPEILRGIWGASGVGMGGAALRVLRAPLGPGWTRPLPVCFRFRPRGSRSAPI